MFLKVILSLPAAFTEKLKLGLLSLHSSVEFSNAFCALFFFLRPEAIVECGLAEYLPRSFSFFEDESIRRASRASITQFVVGKISYLSYSAKERIFVKTCLELRPAEFGPIIMLELPGSFFLRF